MFMHRDAYKPLITMIALSILFGICIGVWQESVAAGIAGAVFLYGVWNTN